MKISAYIPCYNDRSTLRLAVDSIRTQSRIVDEIFVVDDGSKDGSAETVDIPVVRHGKNSGRGAARARGMEEARHELVLCCDAGIKLAPDFLKNALPRFDDAWVAAVFGCVTQATPSNAVERWRGRHLFKDTQPRAVRRAANLATGATVLRASAVKAVGNFNKSLRHGEDAELGARLLAAGFDVICDPALEIFSLTSDTLAQVLERYCRWNTHGSMTLREYAKQISYSIKVMARDDLRAGDPLAALISLLSPHIQFWKSRAQ